MCENFNVSVEIDKNSSENILINGYNKSYLISAKQFGKLF